MVGISPKNLGNLPKRQARHAVTARAEARDLVELIAGPLRLGENVKSALARVARVTGIGDRRIRAIWHHEARRIDAVEMDCLRRAAADERTHKGAHDAYRTFLGRLEAADEALRVSHPHLDRSGDHGRSGVARGADRAVDRGAAQP